MKRIVLYMAHPIRGDVTDNIARALRWLKFLRRKYPAVTFVAPYIASLLSGEDDADPVQRQAGLEDARALIVRLDGVVLVGGRLTEGMNFEAKACLAPGDLLAAVYDMIFLGPEPPIGVAADMLPPLEWFARGGMFREVCDDLA